MATCTGSPRSGYGSLAVKKKYAWRNSADAFPKKRLYLNLLADADPEELGLRYDLRFLTEDEAKAAPDEPDGWYPLTHVMGLAGPGPAMLAEITARGIPMDAIEEAHQRLYDLYEAFRTAKPINYYLETSQDPDKVLDIFVRVNSGGTTLSYSDLLLSMATNQWQHLDAREEVRNLVHQLNTGGSREFNFTKDMVLKTALMIAGVDVRFQVSNFTQDNMKKVEASWEQTRTSLTRAATLVDTFGFTGRTLSADSSQHRLRREGRRVAREASLDDDATGVPLVRRVLAGALEHAGDEVHVDGLCVECPPAGELEARVAHTAMFSEPR